MQRHPRASSFVERPTWAPPPMPVGRGADVRRLGRGSQEGAPLSAASLQRARVPFREEKGLPHRRENDLPRSHSLHVVSQNPNLASKTHTHNKKTYVKIGILAVCRTFCHYAWPLVCMTFVCPGCHFFILHVSASSPSTQCLAGP